MTSRPRAKNSVAETSSDTPEMATPPMRERSVSGTMIREQPLFGRLVGGRYRIRSFIGAGVIGATYLARQASQDRSVAVKSVHTALARRPGFSEAFLREAKVASLIEHPSFVKVLDFGEEPDGTLYVVMEHVEGRSLADVLAESGALAEERIVAIVAQVLRGLAVTHSKGFVHRGIDPQNVLLVSADASAPEAVKVADFGVAALRQLDERGLGRAGYSAPEQARGGKADKRSDVYSMGVVLYEMLTGKFPAVGSPSESAPHATAVRPACSKRLADVAFRAMQRTPSARYPSARAMLDAVLGKSALSDRTTAMAAQDFEEDAEEIEAIDESDLEPSAEGAQEAARAPSRIERRDGGPANAGSDDANATSLHIMAMPDDLPNRTLIMAAAPEASSSAHDVPAAPSDPTSMSASSMATSSMHTPVSGARVQVRRFDWVPFAQGLAVFAAVTLLGLVVLFAVFE